MTFRDPTLRTTPMASDINLNGHIFGGWVLAQMDIAGGIVANRRARGPVATVAIEAMTFVAPILVGDVVSFYADVAKVGRSSIHVRIEAIATRRLGGHEVLVTEGTYIFVAIDAEARPRAVEPG